jgi:hypothetical protein
MALSTAFDLENLMNKGGDSLLQVLFSGGVIRDKKLQKGTIIQLKSSATSNAPAGELAQDLRAIKETVYLLKILFPGEETEPAPPEISSQPIFSKFREVFLDTKVNDPAENYQEIRAPMKAAVHEPRNEGATARSKGPQIPQLHMQVIGKTQENGGGSGAGAGAVTKRPGPIGNLPLKGKPEIPNLGLARGMEQKNVLQINMDLKESQNEREENDRARGETLRNQPEERERNRMDLQDLIKPTDINIGRKAPSGLALGKVPSGIWAHECLGQVREREEQRLKAPGIIEQELTGDFDFDRRDTERKEEKMEMCKNQCSAVLPNGLYVGGELVAKSLEALETNKITHIINCAADVCENTFEGKIIYKTYWLKDAKTEVFALVSPLYELCSRTSSVFSMTRYNSLKRRSRKVVVS